VRARAQCVVCAFVSARQIALVYECVGELVYVCVCVLVYTCAFEHVRNANMRTQAQGEHIRTDKCEHACACEIALHIKGDKHNI
jgi:hypothetical protein